MTPKYLERTNERVLDPDFDGHVMVWDIDKTYLETRFSSARGLLRIPFELAVDKATVPGAVPILRALRRGRPPRRVLPPIYFVSGSPKQIRKVMERKMTLDGVGYDGITFKDQFGLLRSGQGRYIRRQVGYKLRALLLYRKETPNSARYLLFGDDTESDGEVFTLFGEVCAGLRGDALDARLPKDTKDWERDELRALTRDLPVTENPVDGVFIHLARGTPEQLGEGVIATRSYLQTALVLAERGVIAADAPGAVAKVLRRRMVSEAEIRADVDDAVHRLGVSPTSAQTV